MAATLIQVCVDNRLNHELLRIQVRQKLAAAYLQADRIFILNELGGNLGQNFNNTARMLVSGSDRIVMAAILHHDDCKADQAGLRRPLDETVAKTARLLTELRQDCLLVSGQIYTQNNYITWLDEQRIRPGQ
jgi:hypothetical protein